MDRMYPVLGFGIRGERVISPVMHRDLGDVADLYVSVTEPELSKEHTGFKHQDVNHYRLARTMRLTVTFPGGKTRTRTVQDASGYVVGPKYGNYCKKPVPKQPRGHVCEHVAANVTEVNAYVAQVIMSRQKADAYTALTALAKARREDLRLRRVLAILDAECPVCGAGEREACSDVCDGPVVLLDQESGVAVHALRIQRSIAEGKADREGTRAQFGASVPSSIAGVFA
jgi:hypothetical protein